MTDEPPLADNQDPPARAAQAEAAPQAEHYPGEGLAQEPPAAEALCADQSQAEGGAEGLSEEAAEAQRQEVQATVEAILFASDEPLPAAKIAKVALFPSQRVVKQAVAALNARYEQAGSAFRIDTVAGGYRMLTQPQYADVLQRLLQVRQDSRLSQAAMETLAIVAYRQPILRADIEAIRGVACGEVLRGLMEKQLVKIAGRAEIIGRPMLYGTTRRFLELFGISSLEDLPGVDELRGGAKDIHGQGPMQEGPTASPPQELPPPAAPPPVERQPAPQPAVEDAPPASP